MTSGSRKTWARAPGLALLLAVAAAASPAIAEPSGRAAFERGARAVRQGDAAAAAEHLAVAAAQAPEDAEVQALYGQALLAAGRPQEARTALERAIALDPAREGLAYYAGLACFQLGAWEDAVRHLERACAEEPDSGVASLYLGIALSELDRTEEARVALDRAARVDPTLRAQAAFRIGMMLVEARRLDEAVAQLEIVEVAQPGSALARSARATIDEIQSGALRRWNAHARLGGGYDSNVSLGTDEVVGLGISSGVGEAALGGSLALYEARRFELRAGQEGAIRFHGGEPANDFDQVVSSTWATARFGLLERLTGQLAYTFQFVWAGYSPFRSTHVVEPALSFAPSPRFRTDLFYRMEARNYRVDLPPGLEALDRDGFVHRLGFDQYWFTPSLAGWGHGYVKLGVRLRRERTDGTENDADGVEPVAAIGMALPRDLFLTVDTSYEWRDFEFESIATLTPTGKDRFDWIFQIGASLRVPLVGKLYGDARYRFTNRSSNVDLYRYDRHVVDFLLTYPY